VLFDGSYLPPAYFLGYERSRLEQDLFSALKNQTEDKKEMMVCTFFITRVFVKEFALKMEENGVVPNAVSKQQM
jgi:hypothetical protein